MPADASADPQVPAEALEVYERFVESMRAGDLEGAQQLAPGVELAAGHPGDETGPLHPDAFTSDERHHRVLSVQQLGPDRYLLRSGVGYYTLERGDGGYRIVEAGLKPID
jgi:hypothetical protein